MTPRQLEILQHALGCDKFGLGTMYRNRFVTDADCEDGRVCQSLVELGLMHDWGQLDTCGGMHFYEVTDSGKRAMRDESPAPPKLTRSQKRYREFLDADSGLEFSEWIRQRRRA